MSCIQCSRARCRDTVIRTGRNQVLKVALIVGVLVQGAHYPESGRSRLRCRPVCGRPSHHLHHWGLRGDSRRFHGDGRHEASPGTAMRVSVGLRPRPPGDSNTSPRSPGPRTRRTHPRSPCGRGVKHLAGRLAVARDALPVRARSKGAPTERPHRHGIGHRCRPLRHLRRVRAVLFGAARQRRLIHFVRTASELGPTRLRTSGRRGATSMPVPARRAPADLRRSA